MLRPVPVNSPHIRKVHPLRLLLAPFFSASVRQGTECGIISSGVTKGTLVPHQYFHWLIDEDWLRQVQPLIVFLCFFFR